MMDMPMGCGQQCGLRDALEATNMKMHSYMAIEFSCDLNLDFVRSMIPHHQGAVDMCADLRQNSPPAGLDAGIVHFCYHVELEQMYELAIMDTWLKSRGQTGGTTCDDGSMGCGDLSCASSQAFVEANHVMHKGMAVEYNCVLPEVDFVRGMIPHHQGGVDMCSVILSANTADSVLTALCENITKVQNAEIMWMSEWLSRQNYAQVRSCYEDYEWPGSPCFDMLSITDFCHDLGGDGVCDCSNMLESCGEIREAQGRAVLVDDVCPQTCGLCEIWSQTRSSPGSSGEPLTSGTRWISVIALSLPAMFQIF